MKGQRALTRVQEQLRPRTGEDAYVALFGQPIASCCKVLHLQDQVVPRLDCCIWLEFRTCPSELRRITALEKYKTTVYLTADSAQWMPLSSPKPAWWTPAALDKHIVVLSNYEASNPNRRKLLLFAKDSTRAFYCDMAD